jgi:pimeloyl-ACP methyl ester carboxylesterase
MSDSTVQYFETRDGVRLAYTDRGEGAPAVLLHGMACNRSHMEPIAAHLAANGRRAVSLDMRGHGDSDVPEGEYSIGVLGDDALDLIEHLGVSGVTLIGHSLGGSIGMDLAVRRPDVFSALVAVDSGIRQLSAFSQELAPFYARIGGPDHVQTVRDWLIGRVFEDEDPPELREAVLDLMSSNPPHAFVAMANGISGFNSAEAAMACTIPALVIMADRPFVDLAVLPKLPPNWRRGWTVGAGHFNQLIVPDQVNAMIDRFLALAAAGEDHRVG